MRAVYPGSFDPPTNGHLDIITRASKLVDTLVVGVLNNTSKTPLFSTQERLDMLLDLTKDLKNVQVVSFSGLLVNLCKDLNCNIIIRGLRAMTDFEYEFQIALTNKTINPQVETLFLPTSTQNLWLSSSAVKEIAMFKGPYDSMVPEVVKFELDNKFK